MGLPHKPLPLSFGIPMDECTSPRPERQDYTALIKRRLSESSCTMAVQNRPVPPILAIFTFIRTICRTAAALSQLPDAGRSDGDPLPCLRCKPYFFTGGGQPLAVRIFAQHLSRHIFRPGLEYRPFFSKYAGERESHRSGELAGRNCPAGTSATRRIPAAALRH